MTDEQIQNTGATEENRSTDELPEDDPALEAENRQLRERVAALESALGDIRDELADVKNGDDGDVTGIESPGATDGADATPELLTSGGQPTKVIGTMPDDDGIGVLGNATGSGTTYGVMGEVSSGDGYGLYTPDRGRVEGDMEVLNDLRLNPENEDPPAIWFNDRFFSAGLNFTDDGELVSTIGISEVQFSQPLRWSLDDTQQRTAGPIAKAYIEYDEGEDDDATVVNGTNINDVRWNDYGYFEVEIDDVDYSYFDYAISVTPRTSGVDVPAVRTNSVPGDPDVLTVRFTDDRQVDFHLVVHELPDGDETTTSTGAEMDED